MKKRYLFTAYDFKNEIIAQGNDSEIVVEEAKRSGKQFIMAYTGKHPRHPSVQKMSFVLNK